MILPDQGSNPCPLCGQDDSQPWDPQGRPNQGIFNLVEMINLHSNNENVLTHTQIWCWGEPRIIKTR